MKTKRIINNTIYHIMMLAICVFMAYPLIWMVVSSFKPSNEIMRDGISLIVKNPTLENYINGWKGFGRNSFAVFFKNSIIIAVVQTVGGTLSSSLAAYAFARIKFTGRKIWFAAMIAFMCIPGMVLQIPRYLLYNSFGWIGTWWPLLIPCWLSMDSADIFMLVQFMRNIPKSMDQAAEIDGCNWFKLYTHIMLPLIKPALATVAIFNFISAWGDYYSALIYLNKPDYYPVALALKLFADEVATNEGPMYAMSVLSLVPILILFFFFQKQLVNGIATVGVKS